jgi:hypothetical protein
MYAALARDVQIAGQKKREVMNHGPAETQIFP